MNKTTLFFVIALVTFCIPLAAQKPEKPTASQLYHQLQNLNFLGSALYVAAHPDDENTRLISFLANDLHARTAYLSLTRGDGGQNLIGPEIRELLGVIRTKELVAARNTDGGEQIFTRANDFGYSKHPDETLSIWNQEEIVSDVVLAIRKFKPDVIINRFNHRNPGTTHGHHTASAMLSLEAFDLVNNPTNYPASAQKYGVWQPKRLFFNTSWWFYGSRDNFEKADKSNLVEVETGNYYPALGLSNGEIAALSRSMHKSQGFGSTGSRGNETEYLELLKGDMPKDNSNLFEGINTTWSRVKGGEAIAEILTPLEQNFDFKNPASLVPALIKAYQKIIVLENSHWRTIKTKQIEELIIGCSGLYLEAVANSQTINPRDRYEIELEAINRSNVLFTLKQIKAIDGTVLMNPNELLNANERKQYKASLKSNTNNTSAPYWLQEKGTLGMYKVPEELIGLPETPPNEQVVFEMQYNSFTFAITRDVIYKYNDPVDGEVYQPLEIVPAVTTEIEDKVLIFDSNKSKQVPVLVTSGKDNVSGTLQLNYPKGWTVSPQQKTFTIDRKGATQKVIFTVTPPNEQSEGYLKPLAMVGDQFFDKQKAIIDYDHIPYQSVLLPSEAKIVRISIEKKGQNIGYIKGAGDAIPESLQQIGYTVTEIAPNDITQNTISAYDAIVMGIRAYNTVPELAFKQQTLLDYVKNGGTLLIQYNTNRGLVTDNLAPYPLQLSRDRVTDEFAPVSLVAPSHEVLNTPNKITTTDFDGWVQERGLYFPNEWDAAFTPILGMKDKDSAMTQGSLLVAPHGKGYYIYTGLSFFRELPAGVPGAYRLFANLLSLGK